VSDIVLDASTSTGGGGRDWAAIVWSVNCTNDHNITGSLHEQLVAATTTYLEVLPF
jgi:hypothetical protein